ncbi:Y+L amino acid transporter [Wickerhamomyces ciferrii]|uniref:Y+L amino acid transporter n=1 Tax=Wickerhamomyces ciferrii (strain ATCC 14091 / BCRC 22168 / CBS 111 / JCM 3599 / NBRC 0793 / NRRL Y-1031 F-60-10) TaxID=1206466 RepID=K0KX29_WICCF|nr:Y+L amino acid transporter [Wickerhamomyces ciferrii]CCH46044.1 Y+L amino acid transporter [Wickerhamomyces ciferrii]
MIHKTQVATESTHLIPRDEEIHHDSDQQHQHTQHTQPHLGVFACMSLIINKMIGTGIFSTPSLIFSLSGNIGTSLILWGIGGIITFCGLSVYLEFGLELPKSGGEKNYLQRVFTRPEKLIECIYAFQIVLLGFSSGNSYAFGKYILFALGFDEHINDWIPRIIGIGVITFAIYLHIYHPNSSTKVFTFLGFTKILILMIIIFLGGLTYLNLIEIPQNDNFNNIWQNYPNYSGNSYNISVALLQVIYSFKGWENANYVLSEIKNPHQTLKVSAPLSVLITTILYFLVILSYYLVIPKEEFADSGVVIAGIFFNKILGESITSRLLPILISLSNFGNVLAVSFSHSRINQELSKEGFLPFSSFFAVLKNSIFLHWLITVIILLIPPKYGNIYQFVVNLYAYPGTWVNIFVALGLIYLHFNKTREKWGLNPNKWHSFELFNFIFLGSNIFLALFPFIPPPLQYRLNNDYPFYVFPLTGIAVLGSGGIYWYFRYKRKSLY